MIIKATHRVHVSDIATPKGICIMKATYSHLKGFSLYIGIVFVAYCLFIANHLFSDSRV